ncbi:hypothetical protein P872_05010 [Rhodonellum psychrophilum GCM71 = DSM 17998]|uniref:Uncharacterized protein n=2 Tax=Rhodonellum TaxID=336827 RepID=U5BQW6_9BACT|nr:MULTISPECIES: hypothetical protein [Rhodonellum]ERM82975.1 hypothetical protein P872_05010 [Rhodonellum psychrophilum GCM71 = DSM 17998]SDZ36374.1 hypothetical protein SAMN05444412_111102 [Rhodonellum ikkaensis]
MKRTRAQESRAAIERLYITMRHLFMRGSYKPMGVSGESLVSSLLVLSPEIYGLVTDTEKIELEGLLYVMERLPRGIEECRYVQLISREGYESANFPTLVPNRRKRNCYRVDQDQMFVEMTRGKSDIYDILTHLTFLYMEAEKIRLNSTDHKGKINLNWEMLAKIVKKESLGEEFDQQAACSYLSHITGRTFDETQQSVDKFKASSNSNSLFSIVYHLGKLAMDEFYEEKDREISFSATLRERVGHHVYGELWANRIKAVLDEEGLLERPIHVISANLHSVLNTIYGFQAFGLNSFEEIEQIALDISVGSKSNKAKDIHNYASKNGFIDLPDLSGTNIGVQIFDTAKMSKDSILPGIVLPKEDKKKPVILVMDYAFGEQAYECFDELLKPYEKGSISTPLDIVTASIMGKAGILKGTKGDLMIPTSHVFEGTADNYPFKNEFKKEDFEGFGLGVYEGPMITVLGTSLQNKDVLAYFMDSSWKAIGLEMEGAHYQKAIQAASKIRHSIRKNVKVFYAYYASDNPLETGGTLASGALGMDGVRPTYLITHRILERIFS